MNALYRWFLRSLSFFVVLALSATIASAQDQTAQKASGSSNVISGRITTNDNQPLTNARVTVNRPGGGVQAQFVKVDSEGNFVTPPLEPGLYFVAAYVPGLIRDPSTPPTSSYFHPGDHVDFKMIKGGVLTGTVKNANGDALVAVGVRAIRVRAADGTPAPFSSATRETLTDDRGMYRLYGLGAGSYIVSAGGQTRLIGSQALSAYESFVPTYAPSATRDTAMEFPVTSGNETQADIQFREERGHVISGAISGAANSTGPQQWGAGVVVYDSRNHLDIANATAVSTTNFSFVVYGVSDGDYELSATQGSSTGDQLSSAPLQVKVQGADVTGLRLTVAPLASIEGRVSFEPDPKAACGKHKASALIETVIGSRRFEPRATAKATAEVPAILRNTSRSAFVDARGVFSIKNVPPGSYEIEPTPPAPGWYVRSVALEKNAAVNISRDGLLLKSGDRISGVAVTFAEGAAQLKGKLTTGEGQSLPSRLRVYLVPDDRLASANLYRFYETGAERDGSFTLDNVAPGKYLIVARPAEPSEPGTIRIMRLDETFRATVLKEAEAQKKSVALKPCEQLADFDLPYVAPLTTRE